jgi:hypothetical protein
LPVRVRLQAGIGHDAADLPVVDVEHGCLRVES